MTSAAKYHMSKIVVLLTVPAMSYCIARMVPAGMGGDIRTVKFWAVAGFIFFIAGAAALVVMRYNKSLSDNPAQNEVEILARTAADMARDKQAAAQAAKDPTNPPGPSAKTER